MFPYATAGLHDVRNGHHSYAVVMQDIGTEEIGLALMGVSEEEYEKFTLAGQGTT